MFRTRVRKILGDVSSRKGRTFLVSFAIFIGVFGTIALFSMSDILVSQLREDIKEDELAMLQVFSTVNAGTVLNDTAYLQQLSQLQGVTEVEGIVSTAIYFKTSEDAPDFEDGTILAYSAPFEPELPIQPVRLIDGAYPAPNANEVAIEQRMADKYDLSVGDTLYIRILSPSSDSALNGEIGTVEPRTISGIIFDPYSQTNAGPDSAVYANVNEANYIAGSIGYTGYLARYVDYPTAEDQQDVFAAWVANNTPYRPIVRIAQDPAENQQIASVQTLANTMSFLAIVALVVSGFLVINVISSIVVEQKRQIGVMKSMGASRWDNVFMYSGIALMYGIIGVIPGVILGIPAGNAAAHALGGTLGTIITGFRTSPSSIFTGIFVGLLIPVLSSLIPVWLGTRVKIMDAMTDLGIDAKYGSGPIARLIAVLPIPITIRQGLSNVSIKKSRLAFTVITLSIAAGAFMGISAVFSSLTSGIDSFLDTFSVEIAVIPNQGRPSDEVISVLDSNFRSGDNPVLENIEPGFQTQVEFEGYEPVAGAGGPPAIFAYGYDINSANPAFNFTVDEGEPLTDANSANGIIISSLLAAHLLAADLGNEVGDRVTMTVPGSRAEMVIVGISEFPIDQVWMDWRTLATITGSSIARDVQSPVEVPEDLAPFVTYATDVTVNNGATPVTSYALTGAAGQTLSQLITEGALYSADTPGVIISSALAESGSYSVGDTISLTSTQAEGTTADYAVTGIIDIPEGTPVELPAEFIATTQQDLYDLDGVSVESVPLPQAYFITTTLVDPTADQLDDVLDDITEALLNNGISVQGFNFVALTDQISMAFTTIQAILQAVALLIALVGALGLLTTLSMSVFERQKEIGVMRSIGAGSATVASQFLTEGMVVGFISWVFGLPIGYLLAIALLNVTGLSEVFTLSFPISIAITGLVGMLIIATIASLWPSLSAARKTVSDILRYQ